MLVPWDGAIEDRASIRASRKALNCCLSLSFFLIGKGKNSAMNAVCFNLLFKLIMWFNKIFLTISGQDELLNDQ